MLGRGKPVPDANNVSVRTPTSWEGTPPGMEVCIGEELASPELGIETVACSEARATFMALTTAAKKARSGAAGGEKEEPAKGVDTGGATGTTELIVTFVDKESMSEASGASDESRKKPADMLLFVWHGVVIAKKNSVDISAIASNRK